MHGDRKALNNRWTHVREPPEESVFPYEWREQVARRSRRLGGAQEQEALRFQREVEERHDSLLQRHVEVDEHISTHHEIQLGERRVHYEILGGENHSLTDFLAHTVRAIVLLNEESIQALFGYVLCDGRRIVSRARLIDRVRVEIRGKDLERTAGRGVRLQKSFFEHHRQSEGLFTR